MTAMTIHKAQGLSLDRALVDLGQCWGAGQAYVALSRCRSLAGLEIRSFSPSVFKADPKCVRFYNILMGKSAIAPFSQAKDQTKMYQELIKDGLSLFFDQAELSQGQEDRDKQIFLETVADLYDESLNLHKARKAYSSPRKPRQDLRGYDLPQPLDVTHTRGVQGQNSNFSIIADILRSTSASHESKLDPDAVVLSCHESGSEKMEVSFGPFALSSSQTTVASPLNGFQSTDTPVKRSASHVQKEDVNMHKKRKSPKRETEPAEMIDLT